MEVSEIKLYEMLKSKIGSKEAEGILSLLTSKVEKEFETHKEILATKADIAKSESSLTMKMFLFWIGQLAALFGIIKFML